MEPIEDLLKQRSEVCARLDVLPAEIEKLSQGLETYRTALQTDAPWWRRLLGNWQDETVKTLSQRLYDLKAESWKLKQEQSRLQMAVENVKKTRKRFLEAQIAHNAAATRRLAKADQHAKFCSDSAINLTTEFDRTKFCIQPHDYRRGNAIDNYFRRIETTVLAAFGHACVFCGSSHNLTFDHYGLAKNEGGNFALVLADKTSISLNIVVLCRTCNAAKGQRSYQLFFNDTQQKRATACQRALLQALLADENFLRLIEKRHR